jgi:hypothetical protein
MARFYKMRAKDSITAAVFTWLLSSLDFSGSGYPGPNAAANIQCTGFYDDGAVTTASHGSTVITGHKSPSGTAELMRWGVDGILTFGSDTNVSEIRSRAASTQRWYAGGGSERMALDTAALYLSALLIHGSAPATTGQERFGNNQRLAWRSADNTFNVQALWLNTSNALVHGDGSTLGQIFDSDSTGAYIWRWEGVNGAILNSAGFGIGTTLLAGSHLAFGGAPAGGGTVRFSTGNNISVLMANGNTVNYIGETVANTVVLGGNDNAISGGMRFDLGSSGIFDFRTGASTNVTVASYGMRVWGSGSLTFTSGNAPGSGLIRVPANNVILVCRNFANTLDTKILEWVATDRLNIGDDASVLQMVSQVMLGGEFFWEVNDGTAMRLSATSGFWLPALPLRFGANPATGGTIRGENEFNIQAKTVGGTSVGIFRFASDDRIYVGNTGGPTNVVGVMLRADTEIKGDVGANTRLNIGTNTLTLGHIGATGDSTYTTSATGVHAFQNGSLSGYFSNVAFAVTRDILAVGSGSVANGGTIRLGSSITCNVRNNGNSADAQVFGWAADQLSFGGDSVITEMRYSILSGSFRWFIAGTDQARITTTGFQFVPDAAREIGYLDSSSTGTGPTLTIRGQIRSGTSGTNTGGTLELRGGSATGGGATHVGGNVQISGGSANGAGGTRTGGNVLISGGQASAATAGAVKIQNPSGVDRFKVDATGVAFFNVATVGQQTVNATLTGSFGSAGSAIVDMGASYNQTNANNNIRRLQDAVNALRVAVVNLGLAA